MSVCVAYTVSLLSCSVRFHSCLRYPPFFDEHPFRIYEKILEGKIDWPKVVGANAKDLIKKLLVRDVTRRLGNLKVCESNSLHLLVCECVSVNH